VCRPGRPTRQRKDTTVGHNTGHADRSSTPASSQSYESPTVPIDWVIPNRRQSFPIVVRRVLAAVVAVEHDTADPMATAALTDRCFEGVGDELGAHVPGQ
jgi:hypothetical protein